jgi:hypothetical protein
MGYVIRAKDNMQKNEIFNFLHSKGLASKPSPFPSRAEICRYVVIFKDHFYTAHGIDLNAVMEGEEMFELRDIKELKSLWTK